jgi:hypothetical protein
MSRLASRLAKLEGARQSRSQWDAPWHITYAKPDMTGDDHLAELVAQGRADPGDNVIVIQFVQPGPNGPEWVYPPEPEGIATWR